jgi:hypothetical protein
MIPIEIVADTWQRMSELGPDEGQALMDQLVEEQPTIGQYLLGMEDVSFDDDERDLVYYVSLVVWQIMKQGEPQLGRISLEDLQRAEDENFGFLAQIAQDTPADFVSAIQTMLERHPEPEVLRSIGQALAEENLLRYEQYLHPQNRPLAFLHLKILLDTFISAANRQRTDN